MIVSYISGVKNKGSRAQGTYEIYSTISFIYDCHEFLRSQFIGKNVIHLHRAVIFRAHIAINSGILSEKTGFTFGSADGNGWLAEAVTMRCDLPGKRPPGNPPYQLPAEKALTFSKAGHVRNLGSSRPLVGMHPRVLLLSSALLWRAVMSTFELSRPTV